MEKLSLTTTEKSAILHVNELPNINQLLDFVSGTILESRIRKEDAFGIIEECIFGKCEFEFNIEPVEINEIRYNFDNSKTYSDLYSLEDRHKFRQLTDVFLPVVPRQELLTIYFNQEISINDIEAYQSDGIYTFNNLTFDENFSYEIIKNRVKFYPEKPGMLLFDGSKFSMTNKLTVESDIDKVTKSIKACADISIKGCIRNAAVFEIDGNIAVGKHIEDSEIICSGNLNVADGIYKNSDYIIKIGGNLKVKFLQKVNIEVGGDIEIEDYISNSNVRAGGFLDCKNAIISGSIYAKGGAKAEEIGSKSIMPLQITIGPDVPSTAGMQELKEELEQLATRIEQNSKNINFLSQKLNLNIGFEFPILDIINIFEKSSSKDYKKFANYKRINLLLLELWRNQNLLESKREKYNNLSNMKVENVEGRLIVRKKVNSNLIISMGFYSLNISKETGPIEFYYDEGVVKAQELNKEDNI